MACKHMRSSVRLETKQYGLTRHSENNYCIKVSHALNTFNQQSKFTPKIIYLWNDIFSKILHLNEIIFNKQMYLFYEFYVTW